METVDACRRKGEEALRHATEAGENWARRSTFINQALYWDARARRIQLELEVEDAASSI